MVPPLEGFWWQDGVAGVDYSHKDSFQWISVIRLPDFVTKDDFDWAVRKATAKKNRISLKLIFLPMMKDCVFSVCISGLMMMSLPR